MGRGETVIHLRLQQRTQLKDAVGRPASTAFEQRNGTGTLTEAPAFQERPNGQPEDKKMKWRWFFIVLFIFQ